MTMDWRIERRRRGPERVVETNHVRETIPDEILDLLKGLRDHLAKLAARIEALEQNAGAGTDVARAMLEYSQHLVSMDTRLRTVENQWNALEDGIRAEARRRNA